MKIPNSLMKPGTPNKLKMDKRFLVIQRDGAKCKVCGTTNPELLTVDHILPKILGGEDTVENMQILCKRCHRKKDRDIPHQLFRKY